MSIQQKGDIYYVVVMYRDNLGKKKYKWVKAGKSIKEAQKLERKLRSDIDSGEQIISEKTTLKQYLTKWLEVDIVPERRPSTVVNYQCAINNICSALGEIRIEKLKPIQIQEHLNQELQRGLKPTSVRLQYTVLSHALKRAVQWQLIPKNPCEGVKSPGINKPKNTAYSPKQMEILLDVVKQTNLYIPVLLAALCGLRRGEVCGLRWEDISFEKKTAMIRHSLNRTKGKLTLGAVKTEESEATIPLPDILIEQLKIEQKMQKINRLKLGSAYQDDNYIWVWEDGRPHDPDYLYHAFQKTIKKHNNNVKDEKTFNEEEVSEKILPVIRFHDLRHTHATLLLAAKVDIKIVSKKLRHSKASFTADVYQHVLEDMQRETADAMDNMFGKDRLEKESGLEIGLEKRKKLPG